MKKIIQGWTIGHVDTTGEHIKIIVGERELPCAYVCQQQDDITVMFVVDPFEESQDKIKLIVKELDYYFKELKEPDPWLYATYHCGTASNMYSSVHWILYEPRKTRKRKKSDKKH